MSEKVICSCHHLFIHLLICSFIQQDELAEELWAKDGRGRFEHTEIQRGESGRASSRHIRPCAIEEKHVCLIPLNTVQHIGQIERPFLSIETEKTSNKVTDGDFFQ